MEDARDIDLVKMFFRGCENSGVEEEGKEKKGRREVIFEGMQIIAIPSLSRILQVPPGTLHIILAARLVEERLTALAVLKNQGSLQMKV